tara:strand:+ start:7392 stop:8219 length:828 start_codon:yes stop_codon:yes gene_type:complete
MVKKIATIILNRNLPVVTNKLVEHIEKYDGKLTDIYVIEAGSDEDKLSKYTSWHANWEDAKLNGLRYSRGMNYGLSQLWENGLFKKYDAFFLLTNDTELNNVSSLEILINILDQHQRIGILSPCGIDWGERFLFGNQTTKYFWFIHNTALLLRREFLESILVLEQPYIFNFLFDGSNFRGYGLEHELISKAYANDWAAAITNLVYSSENESYLLNKNDIIKTDSYENNMKLYLDEGKKWMRRKYGFNNHWYLQQYAKTFYDKFFELYPELRIYQL